MSALDKVLKLGIKSFTTQVEDLGMRAADDTSASLISQADVALKRIASKGENRQPSRLDKELRRHGVTNFELEQANFEALGNKEATKLKPSQIETLGKDRSDLTPRFNTASIVRDNYTALSPEDRRATENILVDLPLDLSRDIAKALQKQPGMFPNELRKKLTEVPGSLDLKSTDVFKTEKDGGKDYLSYTLPDVNRATYKEEVYSSPNITDLGQRSKHFEDEDYQFHVRYDVVGQSNEKVSFKGFMQELDSEGPDHPSFGEAAGYIEDILNQRFPTLEADEVQELAGEAISYGTLYVDGVNLTEEVSTAFEKAYQKTKMLSPSSPLEYLSQIVENQESSKIASVRAAMVSRLERDVPKLSETEREWYVDDWMTGSADPGDLIEAGVDPEEFLTSAVKHLTDLENLSTTQVPTRRIFELQSDLVNEELKASKGSPGVEDPQSIVRAAMAEGYENPLFEREIATFEASFKSRPGMATLYDEDFDAFTDLMHDYLDTPQGTNEMEEVLRKASVRKPTKPKGLPYNFRTEALKRQLVDAHNDGQKEVWLAIRPEGFGSLVRGKTVQKEYDESMPKVANKLAKRIGAKVTRDKGWLKIALPTGGFSLPLLAEESDKTIEPVQGFYPASEEAKVQQTMEDPNVSNTDKLRAFRQSNRETGRFGTEMLPEASGLSEQELSIPSPSEMASKVQGLLTSGMEPSQLQQSLASRYDEATANNIMLEALQPKIDKMLADGVSEAQIAESLQGKGIQYEAQNQPPQDENNLDIGQAGPESNQAVVEPESVQTQPIINTDLEPDEIFTQLTNIHNQYSHLGYTVLGWTGLSPSAKGKAKQIQTETSNLVKKGMEERGYEVLSVDEFGTMMVLDKDTGKPREVDDSFLASIGASGVEVASAFGGAIAGAKAGALATAAVPVPGARVAGAFVGGLLGGALGAAGGRGVDVYRHADDLNYELTVNEVLGKMADAGVADATMGVLGTSAVKLVKGAYTGGKAGGRALARGYDLVVKGNPQGAVKALLEGLTLSEGKAIDLVKTWERATGNSLLSAEALETGKLAAKDLPALLQSLALTQPRATSMVKAASQISKSGGSKLSLQLDDRAAQVLEVTESMTNENVVTTMRQGLDTYVSDTNEYFGSIKDIGVSQMADTGYRFDFNKVPLEVVVRETKDKVLNNAIRRDVDNYLRRIQQLSGKTAVEAVEASGSSPTPQAIEAANPLREFGNLLELRSVVNQFFSDSRFKAFYNQKALSVAKEAIDKEIAATATNVMPGGEAWLKHWRSANAEYHKMKLLESNVLYKALTKETVSAESAVNAITKSIVYESPATFMQVMGKLPQKVRVNVEGAVLSNLVRNSTVGFDGGHKAINFVKLSGELQQMAFTQPAARDLKRVVGDMAEVYKNDPHLSAAVGNIPLPKFQNALTTDVTAKVKYAVASSVFHAIKARIPFSTNAGRAALVNHLSKVLDNPLSAKSTKALLKELPNDPTLKTDLQNLAIQYTKFGKPENYGKIPVYKVVSSKDLGKSRQTALGKGHMAYTNKATADKIAKATSTKVVETLALPKAIATEVDVTKLLGHTPTKEELRSLDVAQALKDKGFVGLTAEDKVLFF